MLVQRSEGAFNCFLISLFHWLSKALGLTNRQWTGLFCVPLATAGGKHNEPLCSPSGHGKGERQTEMKALRKPTEMGMGCPYESWHCVRCWDSHACPWREGKGDKTLSDEVSKGSALPHIRLFTCSRVKLMRRDLRQCTQRCLQSYLKGLLETGVEMVALRRGECSCLWGWDGAGWMPPCDEERSEPSFFPCVIYGSKCSSFR